MFKMFNVNAVTKNQRFLKALICGLGATIGITLIYGLISSLLHFEFSIVYLAIGALIGYVIQKTGKGVQIQFSILGAVLALLCFFVGDMLSFFGFGIFSSFTTFTMVASIIFRSWLSIGLNSLISLAFRVFGIVFAFYNSRII